MRSGCWWMRKRLCYSTPLVRHKIGSATRASRQDTAEESARSSPFSMNFQHGLSTFRQGSEFGDFAEVEVFHFHGRDHHVERLFAGSTHGRADHFDVGQHLDDALIETKIAQAAGDVSVLDQKRAIASHARK